MANLKAEKCHTFQMYVCIYIYTGSDSRAQWVLGYEKELACKIKVFSTASEFMYPDVFNLGPW